MLRSPTVRDDGSGNAVLVKHAIGTERPRLRHEAGVLDAARIEGVVESVGFDEVDERCELRLRYLEAATLAEQPPLGLVDLLDVLIDLGTTLAELHARGIRHGALRGEHVLLARPRRPVICGFGEATGPADQRQHLPGADLAALAVLGQVELARTDRSASDPAERQFCGDALIASGDLAAVASASPHDSEALKAWLNRLRHVRNAAVQEHAVTADGFGSEQARVATLGHEPHGLRERLRADITASSPPDGVAHPPRRAELRGPMTWDRRRVGASAAAVAALAVAAFIGWQALAGSQADVEPPGTALLIASRSSPVTSAATSGALSLELAGASAAADDHGQGSTALPDATITSGESTSEGVTLLYSTATAYCPEWTGADLDVGEGSDGSVQPSEPPSTPPQSEGASVDATDMLYHVDVRGDGCPVPVHIEMPDAHRRSAAVRTPHGEWTLGADGDLVAVGDWDCDGRSTLAVVKPGLGIVGFYGSWPPPDRPVVPTRIAVVPQHADAVSRSSSFGAAHDAACDALVVHYGDLQLTLSQREPAADAALVLSAQSR
ncbi:hypothetical protein [Candidatus Poriferisodalis sp.]|uniref:hypothetical protein n=1 Tax=Candidatus Poriferisodalis sp. TaxID=3101277 RepID=UPI003B525699